VIAALVGLVAGGCGRLGFASHRVVTEAGVETGTADGGGVLPDSSTPPPDAGARSDGGELIFDAAVGDAAPPILDGGLPDAGPCPPSCDRTAATTELLVLKTGDPDWLPLSGPGLGDPWGTFFYFPVGPTLVYAFEARGLDPSVTYSLISYTDPWPGTPAIELARGAPASSGSISFDWAEHEFDRDLADLSGKIWLVNSAHMDVGAESMTTWEPANILFELSPITYDDTDVP